MPWVKNASGVDFQVSAQRAAEMVKEDDATIIPDPTIKDPREVDPRSNEAEQNMGKLRAQFKEKYNEEVPNNMKNNATWIASKL
jgi:hypothetical protein